MHADNASLEGVADPGGDVHDPLGPVVQVRLLGRKFGRIREQSLQVADGLRACAGTNNSET